MIGKRRIVVLVELDVEIRRLPNGEVIFPFGAGAILRGDGLFARGPAERLQLVGSHVHEHGDFDELASVENEIGGFAIAFGMIEIGGNGGRDFGAFAVVDGVEEATAGRAVGILVADVHFGARFEVEAEEAFDGFADVVAANLEGRGSGRLLREWQAGGARRGERDGAGGDGDERNQREGNDVQAHRMQPHSESIAMDCAGCLFYFVLFLCTSCGRDSMLTPNASKRRAGKSAHRGGQACAT